MRIKVLMVGNQNDTTNVDAEMLKEMGFMVYTCQHNVLKEMVEEVCPDVVFVNPQQPDVYTTKAYHALLKNKKMASIPVIYTVTEDDLYLVNLPRLTKKKYPNLLSDNIVDGIRTSLHYEEAITNTNKQKIYPFVLSVQRA